MTKKSYAPRHWSFAGLTKTAFGKTTHKAYSLLPRWMYGRILFLLSSAQLSRTACSWYDKKEEKEERKQNFDVNRPQSARLMSLLGLTHNYAEAVRINPSWWKTQKRKWRTIPYSDYSDEIIEELPETSFQGYFPQEQVTIMHTETLHHYLRKCHEDVQRKSRLLHLLPGPLADVVCSYLTFLRSAALIRALNDCLATAWWR